MVLGDRHQAAKVVLKECRILPKQTGCGLRKADSTASVIEVERVKMEPGPFARFHAFLGLPEDLEGSSQVSGRFLVKSLDDKGQPSGKLGSEPVLILA